MPGGDRTGPAGMGPMTGRATGFCGGYPAPGYMNPAFGRGYWGGARGGRGHRHWFYATGLTGWQRAGGYPAYGTPYGVPPAAPFAAAMTSEQEAKILKGQAEYLEDALDGIRKRLDELEAKAGK
jgi:hypothetical protein